MSNINNAISNMYNSNLSTYKVNNVKNIYLEKTTVKSIPHYPNLVDSKLVKFPSKELLKGVKFKKITISIPKELKSYRTIINYYSKLIDYEYKNFYLYWNKQGFLYLDIIYIDREVFIDYRYATCDTVYFISSGKRMKDIRKYNPLNSNHIYIKKGNKIPVFSKVKKGYEFIKTNQLSNSLDYEKIKDERTNFKELLLQIKKLATIIMNKLLNTIRSSKVFVVVSEYRGYGFKTFKQQIKHSKECKEFRRHRNKLIDEENKNIKEYNFSIWKKIQITYKILLNNRRAIN